MIEWISHFWQENNKYEFNFGRGKLIKSKLQVAFRWTVTWCIFNGALGFDFTKFIFDGAKNGSDAKFDPVKMNAIYQNMKRAMSALFMRQIYQISCLLFGGYFAIWSKHANLEFFSDEQMQKWNILGGFLGMFLKTVGTFSWASILDRNEWLKADRKRIGA